MQMICRLKIPDSLTVLLRTCQAVRTATTDTTREPDPNESSEADRWVSLWKASAEFDDAADAFVPADVWEFDVCDGVAVWAGGGAAGCVQV